MMIKKLLSILLLFSTFSTGSVIGKTANHLENCWNKQVKKLKGQYLECLYRENNDKLYHSFKQWDIIHNTSKGTLWYNENSFLMSDTLKDKYFSKTQYNDSELLFLNYGNKKISGVTLQEYAKLPM